MTTESFDELRGRLLSDPHVQQMIRARAYEIYLLRGQQPGGEAHDWFQAENEVLAFLMAGEAEQPETREETSPAQVNLKQEATAKPAPKRSRQAADSTGKADRPAKAKSRPKKPSRRKSPNKKSSTRKETEPSRQ